MNLGWRDAFYRFFVCCLAVEPAEVIIIQSRQPVNILLQVLCVALQDIVLALLEIFVGPDLTMLSSSVRTIAFIFSRLAGSVSK